MAHPHRPERTAKKPSGGRAWSRAGLEAVAPGAGIYAIEFAVGALSPGEALEFTFYWSESARWEGRNFVVDVLAGGE